VFALGAALLPQPLATGDPIPLPPEGGSLLGDFL
jgi:hypothetical protein